MRNIDKINDAVEEFLAVAFIILGFWKLIEILWWIGGHIRISIV